MNYSINGNDLKTIYNVDITNVISPLLSFPDRKSSATTNWDDEDGQEIDLSQPKFASRSMTFNCVCSGNDIDDLQTNYWALFNLLKIAGVYTIYCDFINLSAWVYYTKQDSLSQPYKNNSGGLSVRFNLNFTETDPFANIPNIFLVDEQNRFLVP